jgi:type VI secretion system Hcp family effector
MKKICRLMVAIVFAAVAAPAVADDTVAMKIENPSIVIIGEAPFPHNVNGAIACLAVTGGVVAHEAGARMHLPFVCRKRIDKTSPLLMRSLMQRDKLKVTFSFFRRAMGGADELLYTIELKDARISDIRFARNETAESDASTSTGHGGSALPTSTVTPYEEAITFTKFTKVTWTYKTSPTCTDNEASTDPPQL